jgi:hypothetical protein
MTTFRRLVGWMSWLIVAAHVFPSVWWWIDSGSYYLLPSSVYRWLDELVGPTSCEASADLEGWSTAIVMVLAAHLIALGVVWVLRRALPDRVRAWNDRIRNVFAIAGWSSWLLVLTVTILIVVDYVLRAQGSKLPGETGAVVIEIAAGLCIVGSLHLAVLKFVRRQRS